MTELRHSNILVADNDTAVLQRIAAAMRDYGLTVFTATDYMTARQISRKEDLAFALLSLQLTSRENLPLADQVLENNPDCMIILMTARPSLNRCQQALRKRYLDYLMKPFHLDELKAAIRNGQRQFQEKEAARRLEKRVLQLMEENQQLKKKLAELEEKPEPAQETQLMEVEENLVKKSYSIHTPVTEETISTKE